MGLLLIAWCCLLEGAALCGNSMTAQSDMHRVSLEESIGDAETASWPDRLGVSLSS